MPHLNSALLLAGVGAMCISTALATRASKAPDATNLLDFLAAAAKNFAYPTDNVSKAKSGPKRARA